MIFVVVSQRSKANPYYHLKDLPGHGRFDIIIRCVLAATRQLSTDTGSLVFCYLKGSSPWGWLKIDPSLVSKKDDEISLAAKIQDKWEEIFKVGSLEEMVQELRRPYFLLAEDGVETSKFDGTIFLGAQNDLVEEDLEQIQIDTLASLGNRSLLASHAIIYTRQLNL